MLLTVLALKGFSNVYVCVNFSGILHTRGPCNIGKFNFHFGLPAFVDGRPTGRFPIDFCSNPESLCESYTPPATEFNRFPTTIETDEVKYLIGMTDWIERVQSFNWGYWDYKERLKLFVDGGYSDETFMDGFNELVLDSSHDAEERKANFKKTRTRATRAQSGRRRRGVGSSSTPQPSEDIYDPFELQQYAGLWPLSSRRSTRRPGATTVGSICSERTAGRVLHRTSVFLSAPTRASSCVQSRPERPLTRLRCQFRLSLNLFRCFIDPI